MSDKSRPLLQRSQILPFRNFFTPNYIYGGRTVKNREKRWPTEERHDELLPDAALMDEPTFDAIILALRRVRILAPPTRDN